MKIVIVLLLSVGMALAGHYYNADGTPNDPYHDLHLPHNPPLHPTFREVPKTGFQCAGREWGLHADTEAYCQNCEKHLDIYDRFWNRKTHQTLKDIYLYLLTAEVRGSTTLELDYKFFAKHAAFHLCQEKLVTSFLCPNGTLFHNQFKVCDQFYNVRCGSPYEDL